MSRGDARSEERDGGLGWKDYLALFVAVLETLALPLVILIIALVAILLLSALFR